MNKKILFAGILILIIIIASISFYIVNEDKFPGLENNAIIISEDVIDIDGNDLYEFLQANVSIKVSESGNYSIRSKLFANVSIDKNDDFSQFYNIITSGYLEPWDSLPYSSSDVYIWGEEKYLTTGNNEIVLYYSGKSIYESETNGPYKILLDIFPSDINKSDKEPIISCSLITKNYNYTQFQGKLIRYINSTDYGEDIDNDRLFDFLTIELLIETIIDGNYSFYCQLYGNNVSYLTEYFNIELSKGIQKIPVRFRGYEIFRDRINTSYNVSLHLRDNRYDIYPEDFSTSKYNYLDFERPKAYFTGIITDYGLDKNGNGLFDNLILDIQLQIMGSGNYSLFSALEDSNGRFIKNTQNHTYLEGGIRSMYLEFNGSYFYNHGVDGPYKLNYLFLQDDNDTTFDSVKFMNISFSTSEYNYQDFDPPTTNPPEKPINITGPHEGIQRIEYTFNTSTIEIDGDVVRYAWDWDSDEIIDEWTGFYDSGETCSIVHDWWDPGTYIVRVKAADFFNIKSEWSEPLTIVILPED